MACTSAPCANKYSTTGTLLNPAAKCSGVECRPSKSRQLTANGFVRKILSTAAKSPDLLASNSCASASSVPLGGSVKQKWEQKHSSVEKVFGICSELVPNLVIF